MASSRIARPFGLGHPRGGGKPSGFALPCRMRMRIDRVEKDEAMRTTCRAILAASLMTMPSGSSIARVSVYYHIGSWDAFTGTADDGKPVCGMGSTNPVDNRSLSLRLEIGDDTVQFQARKPTWNIPAGTPIPVVVQIGLEAPWTVQGTGDGQMVQWTIDSDAMQFFDAQFRRAGSLTLKFPAGNEPPWTVGLSGSTAISIAFGRCVTDLTQRSQTRLAPPGPTQPFGLAPEPIPPATPAPSQPAPSRSP